jgi:hypothetical protein
MAEFTSSTILLVHQQMLTTAGAASSNSTNRIGNYERWHMVSESKV